MILVFAGTSDARAYVLEELIAKGKEVIVCTATEYGASLYPDDPHIVKRYSTPMDADAMVSVMREHGVTHVVDATHPYATMVSKHIKEACYRAGLPLEVVAYREKLRQDLARQVQYVESYQEAVACLEKTEGNILLTIGSHHMDTFVTEGITERLHVRLLPTVRSVSKCEALGIKPKQIIAMQGPFSEELNAAIYQQLDIRHMVTKDSGKVGGVEDKVRAAIHCGINVIVIKQPKGEHDG